MTDSSNLDERLDDLASRLLDRDIEFADVPADLRSAVQARADGFARHRSVLLRIDDIDDGVVDHAIAAALHPPTASRFRSSVLGAAAAAIALVIALGAIVASRGGGDDPISEVADAPNESVASGFAAVPQAEAKSQNDAAAAVAETVLATPMQTPLVAGTSVGGNGSTEIADMVALAAIASEWSTTPPSFSEQSPTCALDEGARLVAGEFTFAGLTAEIHVGDRGLVVFSLADCTKMASIAR
ncbi:MAG: hypothetical protein B7C54_06310 [Acidimicrobiales bacterium mtb01]|nr:hypothetical protein [Actinomycetota bacterium]TEX46800.1 MAG: hypothetical protein B7C54_06310 [Acidimicrobiales bacterium mtb01]